MTRKTLTEQIETIITNKLNQTLTPVKATITHTYPDTKHVDINTEEYGGLKHVQTITTHTVGDETILIFLNNNQNEKMVI